IPPLRVNTHAAPTASAPLVQFGLGLSQRPPTIAVLPSADSETEVPCSAAPIAPAPTSLPCWVQAPPLRVNTHAAPMLPLSRNAPTMAVLPSADSETEPP